MITPQGAAFIALLIWLVIGSTICANAYLIARECRSFLSVSIHAIVFVGYVFGIVAIYSGQFLINGGVISIVAFLIIGQFVALVIKPTPKKIEKAKSSGAE